jgi:hypothetical protein
MGYTTNYALSSEQGEIREPLLETMPSTWTLFAILSLFYIALSALGYVFILMDNVYVHGMAEKLTAERIEEALALAFLLLQVL